MEHRDTTTERVTEQTAVIAGKNQWDWIGHGCFNAVVTLAGGSAGALMTNQRGLVHKLSGNDSGPALRGAQDMLLNRRTQRLVLKDLRSSRECKL